ncbi:MAG: alpha/beta hydrolase [Sandaracinaceae bacterium]|nr:alpha/beta hydrolase [Sandaracinaceae bacterium]
MHIDSYGQGNSVVVLHGTPQEPSDLEGLVRALAETRRVHLVHLPGYGREPARLGRYDLDGIERELGAQLSTLAPEGYSLLGVSGGSYRAFRGVQRGTLSPWGIVALGPLPLVVQTLRDGWWGAIGALRGGADMWASVVEGLFTSDFASMRPEVPARYLAQLQGIAAETVAGELEAIAKDPDWSERLRDVGCPVYMRVGDLDVNTPHTLAMQALQWLPRARLDVVANVGHLVHHEDADATLGAVCEALGMFESEAGAARPALRRHG